MLFTVLSSHSFVPACQAPTGRGWKKQSFSNLGLTHLVSPSEKVNICVISCRTLKAAVKWSRHEISWTDPGWRRAASTILFTLPWGFDSWNYGKNICLRGHCQARNVVVEQSCTCCAGGKGDQRGAREPSHEQLIPDTRNVVLLCLLKFSFLWFAESGLLSASTCPWMAPMISDLPLPFLCYL